MIGHSRMHEATQRRLVCTAFVLTCLAPTLGVVSWAVAWRLDSHSALLQQRLGQQFGVVVRAGAVTHPYPNTLHLQNVELVDPETGLNLGQIEEKLGQLEVTSVDEKFSIARQIGEFACERSDLVRFVTGK